jgi:hypothetical protein
MTLGSSILGLVLAGAALAPRLADDSQDPRSIVKAQLEAARLTYEMTLTRAQNGQALEPEQLYRWSVRWMEARRDLSPDKADQVAALEAHHARMQKLEMLAKGLAKVGHGKTSDATAAEYYRLEADLWLARVKGK